MEVQEALYGAIRKFNDRARVLGPALCGLEAPWSLQGLSPLDLRPLAEVNCPRGHDLGSWGKRRCV